MAPLELLRNNTAGAYDLKGTLFFPWVLALLKRVIHSKGQVLNGIILPDAGGQADILIQVSFQDLLSYTVFLLQNTTSIKAVILSVFNHY